MFTYDGSFAMCVTGAAPGTTQTPSATHARTHRQHQFHCVASYEPSLTD